jgi:dihydrolipoamide dehydrogenase
VEMDKVGGTCLNRGCIPTKALYSTAHLLKNMAKAGEHGISIDDLHFDYAKAASRKDEVVDKLVGGVEQLLKAHKVEIFRGRASLEGPGKIKVRSREVIGHLRAKAIILATGSKALRPKTLMGDSRNVLTSTEILAIKELPKSLLVIGGGYIGCEFASIFSAFGTRVTLVEQLPALLTKSDRQAVREIEKSLKEQEVVIHTGTSVDSLEATADQVIARLSSGEEITVEKALVAVGRIPNIADLGLEEAGVAVEKGAVAVDERMATSREGIFAIGDVTNIIQLAHVASYQAEIAVENALGGDGRADYRIVPSTVFTLPELAQVGLTEEECKEQGMEVEVGRFSYQASSKALCDGQSRGMVKIVAAREGGEILGATIVGEEASNLIAEAAAAMKQRLTARQLGHIIHSHPTLPEMMKEAAEDTEGMAVHKVGRRR